MKKKKPKTPKAKVKKPRKEVNKFEPINYLGGAVGIPEDGASWED